MNAPTINGVARAAGMPLILILAAGAGLAVGNLIQQEGGDRSITAQASFSREALDDLQVLREEPAEVAAYPDYAIRHAPAAAVYPDWAIRHPKADATQLTSTFRLTGPSDVEAPNATSDTLRVTRPSATGPELR